MLYMMIQPVTSTGKAWTKNSYSENQPGGRGMASPAAARDTMSFLQVLSATDQQRRGGYVQQEAAVQMNIQELHKKMEESNRRLRERVIRAKNG